MASKCKKTLDRAHVEILNGKGLFNVKTIDAGIVGLTAPNNVLPAGLLTEISPDMVEVITRKRTADMVIGTRKKVLSWGQNDIAVPILERKGKTDSYSDYGNPPASSLNPTFAYAGHYRFSSTVQVGSLQTEQLSYARISAPSELMAASLETLAIDFNNYALFGIPEKPEGSAYSVKGLFNNESLPAYKAAKTTSTNMDFDTVYADIQDMVSEIVTNAKGYVTNDSKMYLAVSNRRISQLMHLVNMIGKNIVTVVKENYPNLEWVYSPEMDGAYTGGLDVMYLRAESDGMAGVKDSAIIGFSEIALASAVEVHSNFTSQVMSSGIAGTIVYRPYMFARRYFAS